MPPRFGTVRPHAFFGARFSSGSCVASLCTTAACGDGGTHGLVGLGQIPAREHWHVLTRDEGLLGPGAAVRAGRLAMALDRLFGSATAPCQLVPPPPGSPAPRPWAGSQGPQRWARNFENESLALRRCEAWGRAMRFKDGWRGLAPRDGAASATAARPRARARAAKAAAARAARASSPHSSQRKVELGVKTSGRKFVLGQRLQ